MIEQLLDDYFLLFFIVGWAGISLIISTMSGWKLLATEYAFEGEVKGEKFRFKSAQMKHSTSYSGCVTFTANAKGLGLSALFVFRLGHAPLFIPWNAIDVKEEKRLSRSMMNFHIKDHEVPIWISHSLGEKILSAANHVYT